MSESEEKYISPTPLIEILRNVCADVLHLGKQEDAHEFLIMFLEDLIKASFNY